MRERERERERDSGPLVGLLVLFKAVLLSDGPA